jgi:hypothetical protein
MNPLAIIGTLADSVTSLFRQRGERKAAKEAAKAKLAVAKQTGDYNIELSDQEWESIAQNKQGESWKDEYVTVSVVSIINMIVVGGIAAAFGHPEVLEGLALAITTLVSAGVDMGFLITATVLAALGLHIKRNF